MLLKDLLNPGGASSSNPEILRGFSDTINDFSQDFLTEVVRSKALARKNFVFSPFSLHVALAMLTSGSTDGSDTQEELLQALGRQRNIQALETKYSEILKEYETLNSTFLFGNRLWISEDKFHSVKRDFIERLERVYSSDVGLLKGLTPEVAVNDWVANRTEGKIDHLFDSLDPSLLLVLTNVIYFKDAWTIPFETQTDSDRRQFHLLDGQTRANVNTMTRSSQQFRARNVTFPGFIKDKNFTVVSIPYKFGFGERFEMLLVTPAESPRDFRLLQDSLLRASETSEREENIFDVIDRAMKEADEDRSNEEIELTMPEFRVENDIDAAKVLNQLGLEGIFELGEFDRMTALPLKVGEVSHAAVIEVDKEGTVGAAATGIELVPWIGTIDEPTMITINKPFLFIIRDKVKNVPLFLGSIVDPVM